jgi:acetyltransferase-like isoleucine patch superfamily enzyme
MPGVTLEEGTAVGAMTLVCKSTDPWGIYVGIPARRLKDRKTNLLDLAKEYMKNDEK